MRTSATPHCTILCSTGISPGSSRERRRNGVLLFRHRLSMAWLSPRCPPLSMYFDSYRSAWLPANLLQAQRDFFGAHTYERIDKPGVFHTDWTASEQEQPEKPTEPKNAQRAASCRRVRCPVQSVRGYRCRSPLLILRSGTLMIRLLKRSFIQPASRPLAESI